MKEIKHLLASTKSIIDHQREKEKILGEKFNIFSILKVERKENETHSAFLAELLNPKGSHLMGNTFLKLFIGVILKHKDISINLNIESANVRTEFYVGERNDELETGGRVDILIFDNNQNLICIENKIDASDQNKQITRYKNYKTETNTVLYLTKFGYNASSESAGTLLENKDYYSISYKTEIIEWLQLCIKESVNSPIVRESIKQYLILIKKITNTMDTKFNDELQKNIFSELEAAKLIADNYKKILEDFQDSFRKSVMNKLIESESEKFNFYIGNPISKGYPQIWIEFKELKQPLLRFGIESFNGIGNFGGNLFVGIFNNKAPNPSEFKAETIYSNWWMNTFEIPEFQNFKVILNDNKLLQKLYSDNSFKDNLILHIVENVHAYLEKHSSNVYEFLKKKV